MTNGNGVSRGDRNRNARLARLRELVPVRNAIVGIDLADRKQMVAYDDLFLWRIGQVDPTIAFLTGTSSRSRASRVFRFRSPRLTPLPLVMNVLLSAMGHQARQAQQGDVPPSRASAQNVFLCRVEGGYARPDPPHSVRVSACGSTAMGALMSMTRTLCGGSGRA